MNEPWCHITMEPWALAASTFDLLQVGSVFSFTKKISFLKLTWHLKMDGWNTSFLLGWPIFRGYVVSRSVGVFFNGMALKVGSWQIND